jgi:hypothetical protein
MTVENLEAVRWLPRARSSFAKEEEEAQKQNENLKVAEVGTKDGARGRPATLTSQKTDEGGTKDNILDGPHIRTSGSGGRIGSFPACLLVVIRGIWVQPTSLKCTFDLDRS